MLVRAFSSRRQVVLHGLDAEGLRERQEVQAKAAAKIRILTDKDQE